MKRDGKERQRIFRERDDATRNNHAIKNVYLHAERGFEKLTSIATVGTRQFRHIYYRLGHGSFLAQQQAVLHGGYS